MYPRSNTTVTKSTIVGGGGGAPASMAILGNVTEGSTLTLTLPTGFTPTSYQWRRNGANIASATNATYVVSAADGSTTLTCLVSGTIAGRAIPAIPDVTVPTLLAAAVQDAFPTVIQFSFSEPLDAASVPAASAFTVPGKTVSSVAVTGSLVNVTVGSPFVYTDTITASYTVPGAGRIRDVAGNLAAAFSGYAVSNNTVEPGVVSTFANSLYAVNWAPNSASDVKTQPALTLPAKTTNILTGGYRDAVFDSEMRVITAAADIGNPSGNDVAVHDYSNQQAFNADSTLFNIQSRNGFHYIVNSTTNAVVNMNGSNPQGVGAVIGMAGNCEPCWHPSDPNILTYTANTGSMIRYQLNVAAKTSSVLFDLTMIVRAEPGMSTAAKCWSMGEGRPSDDWDRWGFLVMNASDSVLGAVVYQRSTNTILRSWQFTSAPNWASISPSGLYLGISWYGTSAGSTYPAALDAETARPLNAKGGCNIFKVSDGTHRAISVIGEHSDFAWDWEGKEVYLSVSFSPGDGFQFDGCVYSRRLEDPTFQTEYPIRTSGGSTGAQIHVSGRAIRRKGWGLVNKSPGVGSGPWDGAVMAVELVPNALTPKIFRAFQHRSAGGDQFASPVATVNNDFTRILAHTQDASGNDVDLCCIWPSWALPVAGARAPTALTAPSIAGSAAPGGTVNVTPGTYGGLPAATVTRVMQQSANGTTGWTDISGATGTSYVVGVANGVYIRNAETANNGTAPNAVQYSNVLLVQALAAPVNTVAPSSPTTGDTASEITAVAGTWTGNPTPSIGFVWQRDTGGGTWVDTAFTTRTATLTPAGTYAPYETASNSQGSASARGATVTISAPAGEPVPSSVITFNQANNTTLETINAAWEGTTRYQVQSSALQNVDPFGAGTALAYLTTAGGANQAVQTTLLQPTDMTQPDRLLHLHLHADNATDGYRCEIGETQIRLYKGASGSPIFGPVAHGVAVASANLTVKFTQLGGRLRAYVNGSGTPVADYTDPSPLAGGYCGVQFYPGADSARIKLQDFRYGSS